MYRAEHISTSGNRRAGRQPRATRKTIGGPRYCQESDASASSRAGSCTQGGDNDEKQNPQSDDHSVSLRCSPTDGGIFAQQSTIAAIRPEGRLYATAAAGAKLLTVNLEAKRVTVIGNTGFPFSLALALCPGGGAYTIANTFDPNKAQLATLNLRTGVARLVGSPLGQALSTMGMTCSRDGTLYAIGQANSMDPDYNSLYTVDRETGLATRIGPTSVSEGMGGFLMALAFAPDGTLYGANVQALFRIDRFTGHATKVVDFMGVTSVMGLAIDEDGNFCIADFVAQSSIYMLNVVTGMATPILNTGLPFVHNIAFKMDDD